VDLERAVTELAGSLPPGADFEAAPRSAILGARCIRGRALPAGPDADDEDRPEWIVLLEPDTEGRLAGYLARFGEGWAATWTVADDETWGSGSGYAAGPLGDELLAQGTAVAGPFRLLLSAATIDR
jgi:hypothetical protein